MALKQLRQASGYEPRTLARQLNISRAQLYAILNGEIKRPPDWVRFVGPLVEACTGGDAQAVSAWRRRHAVLVQVCEELNRQRRLQPLAADPGKAVPRERVAVRHTPADAAQGPAAARGPDWTVPRQLPAYTAHFVGRADELAALDGLLVHAAGMNPGIRRTAGTVMISAISGTAGVGKTALAVHWAHQVADRFPDGQLYVNLRGFDPAGAPMTPADAIRGFLDAFEVPAERIPVSLDAQAALYRSLLAGLRVLVVLDNAHDASQVRPLLPGSPGSSVVVTSRNRLTSLIADGAHPLTVGLFTDDRRPPDAGPPPRPRPGSSPAAGSTADHRPVRPAAAGAEHRGRPGRRPPGLPADGPGRGAARRGGTPAGPGRGRGGQQRHRRVLLVLPAAQRPGGAAVPAARLAPRTRHHRARGRQPGRRPARSRTADAGRTGPRPPHHRAHPGPLQLPRPAPRLHQANPHL